MISRHWFRVIDTPAGLDGAPVMANRLAYSAALMTSLTALGAIAFQSKQIVSGKDPVDMTAEKRPSTGHLPKVAELVSWATCCSQALR